MKRRLASHYSSHCNFEIISSDDPFYWVRRSFVYEELLILEKQIAWISYRLSLADACMLLSVFVDSVDDDVVKRADLVAAYDRLFV